MSNQIDIMINPCADAHVVNTTHNSNFVPMIISYDAEMKDNMHIFELQIKENAAGNMYTHDMQLLEGDHNVAINAELVDSLPFDNIRPMSLMPDTNIWMEEYKELSESHIPIAEPNIPGVIETKLDRRGIVIPDVLGWNEEAEAMMIGSIMAANMETSDSDYIAKVIACENSYTPMTMGDIEEIANNPKYDYLKEYNSLSPTGLSKCTMKASMLMAMASMFKDTTAITPSLPGFMLPERKSDLPTESEVVTIRKNGIYLELADIKRTLKFIKKHNPTNSSSIEDLLTRQKELKLELTIL